MACYTPIPALWEQLSTSFSKRNAADVWRKFHRYSPLSPHKTQYKKVLFVPLGMHNIMLPCSRCIGCKLDRCTSWAIRCIYEARLYQSNYFVTLTFAKSPVSCSIKPFQKFMKRLRKWCKKTNRPSPRYFHATEYGSKKLRPHHHAIIFNLVLDDLELFKHKKTGNLYTSPQLSKLWSHGFIALGAVTHDSAAYVASYTLMKDTSHINVLDGEILEPEQMTCSRAPAIGLDYFLKHHLDYAQNNGFLATITGGYAPIPRTFMNYLKKKSLPIYEDIKLLREARSYERALLKQELTPEMRARNLRRLLDRQKKYERSLDIALPPITLESLKRFRLNNLKGVSHEIVLNP